MKILIISHTFVPASTANAKRPAYFAEAFLKAGWCVDVVVSDRDTAPKYKETLTHPNLKIQRLKDPLDGICQWFPGKIKESLTKSLRAFFWPDLAVVWALFVLIKTKKTWGAYDRIMVCLRPESLLILSLFKNENSRWIYDCQEAFYPVLALKRRSPVARVLAPLLTVLQRQGFKKADCVFFTSETARLEYIRQKLVDAKKTIYVPLFFDKQAHIKNVQSPQQFIIAYFGIFGAADGTRDPEPFFRALNLFLERNTRARSCTKFIFYGHWEIKTDVIERLKLQDVVELNAPVPYEQYTKLLVTAFALLLIVSREHHFFVPSKMLDYFGAKRPILGFVPLDSETYCILKEAGMDRYVSDELDIDGGARSLEQLWQAWQAGRPACNFVGTEKWSASFQMPRVVELLTRAFNR